MSIDPNQLAFDFTPRSYAYEWGDPLPCCGCKLQLLWREDVELCECRCHEIAHAVRSRTHGHLI
jgi:hypothetical protein